MSQVLRTTCVQKQKLPDQKAWHSRKLSVPDVSVVAMELGC